MKTQLITLAAILFVSLSVSAKTGSSNNHNEIPSSYLLNNIEMNEAQLSIESWMINDDLWKNESEELVQLQTIENEEKLEIENWMINNELWMNTSSKAASLFEEFSFGNKTYFIVSSKRVKDAPLKIESWMTDDSEWSL
ncbi:MAG: hypothetical protein PF541_08555 [Prolixibacteraceae bacterium]|jgi:hypothetical protein|nr:hypothetical protein [Prolixibacteraceae bacterium]